MDPVLKLALKHFDVEAFLSQHFEELNHTGAGEIEVLCPKCLIDGVEHEMSVNTFRNLGQCFRCGYAFNMVMLVADMTGITYEEAGELIKDEMYLGMKRNLSSMNDEAEDEDVPFDRLKPHDLPSGFRLVADYCDTDAEGIKAYLLKRGVGESVWREYQIGYSLRRKYRNQFIIPVTYEGNVVYYTTRSYRGYRRVGNPKKQKGFFSKAKVVFGLDRVEEDLNYICIGEGPFDALSLPNGIAPLGYRLSLIQVRLIRVLQVEKIYLCLDGGYKDEAAQMAGLLSNYFEIFMVNLPHDKDPNDLLVKGVDIFAYLDAAQHYTTPLSNW